MPKIFNWRLIDHLGNIWGQQMYAALSPGQGISRGTSEPATVAQPGDSTPETGGATINGVVNRHKHPHS